MVLFKNSPFLLPLAKSKLEASNGPRGQAVCSRGRGDKEVGSGDKEEPWVPLSGCGLKEEPRIPLSGCGLKEEGFNRINLILSGCGLNEEPRIPLS